MRASKALRVALSKRERRMATAPDSALAALDRHALIMTLWLPAALVAAALMHFGLGAGGTAAMTSAFAVILAAFVGHVIVNTVTGTAFTARELALGMVLYLAALLAFGLSALVDPVLWDGRLWAVNGGFLALFFAAIFYLVTARGVRNAFEGFDVIRSFRAAPGDPGRDRR